MANYILLISSMVCGVIHLAYILYSFIFRTPFLPKCVFMTYMIGILTSIWNHGSTSQMAKWIDRIWIYFGVLIDIHLCLFVISPQYMMGCIIAYSVCYIVAKKTKYTIFHVGTHIWATLLHIYIVQYISSNNYLSENDSCK